MSNVDEVRERTDIVALISSYTPLNKAGKTYKGLCPFHGEKTASFVVYPDEGRWHCFGSCATGGDAFDFAMRAENLDFKGALELLARRAGVTLAPATPQSAERRDRRERLREALSMAGAFFRQQLAGPAGGAAREYCARRAFPDEAVLEFGLGWAPDDWSGLTDHLRRGGFSEREILDAGLARERDQGGLYDAYRARVMFPIHDDRGRPVGFGGRTIDPAGIPKYVNSSQTELFDKSRVLYALNRSAPAIRDSGEAVVVEGYTDVLRAHAAGFTNVVASLGTALTEHHLATLKRYARRVVLALDADAAGLTAMTRGLEVAQEAALEVVPVPTPSGLIRYEHRLELDLRVAMLPQGMDPDDLIRADPEAWRSAVASAIPVLGFMFDALTADLELDQPAAKTEAVRRLMPVLAGIPDSVGRAAWAEEYANRLRVDPRALAGQLAALGRRRAGDRPAGRQPARRAGGRGVPGTGVDPGFEAAAGNGGAAVSEKSGRRKTADVEGRLSAWLLGRLLDEPALLDGLVAELDALGQVGISESDFGSLLDRDLFTALVNSRRGAIPPDTPPEHRLAELPTEHRARRQSLLEATSIEPLITDNNALRAILDACLRLRRMRRQRDILGLRLLMMDAEQEERDGLSERVRDVGAELLCLEQLITTVTPITGKVDQGVTRRYDI